ncbi:hypothetical protein ALMP_77230 [Streptomyces sp. A012304]|nr:hypothetical protein ALMP_77230 [Streptomyces sp. A012304]
MEVRQVSPLTRSRVRTVSGRAIHASSAVVPARVRVAVLTAQGVVTVAESMAPPSDS